MLSLNVADRVREFVILPDPVAAWRSRAAAPTAISGDPEQECAALRCSRRDIDAKIRKVEWCRPNVEGVEEECFGNKCIDKVRGRCPGPSTSEALGRLQLSHSRVEKGICPVPAIFCVPDIEKAPRDHVEPAIVVQLAQVLVIATVIWTSEQNSPIRGLRRR